MWRTIAIVVMWLVVVGELGSIAGELSTLERVLRNMDSNLADTANLVRGQSR